MWPHSKHSRISTMNMTAPPIIKPDKLVKQPAMNTVIPPKLVRQGSRIMPKILNAASHLEGIVGKQLQAA